MASLPPLCHTCGSRKAEGPAASMNQLWVWSTAVQTTSVLMIAVFFAVLARSVRLAQVRIWVLAWVCNLLALLVTVVYWYLSLPIGPLIRAGYMGGKAAFVALLIQGAWAFKRPGARLVPARYLVAGLLVYAALCAALPLRLEQVGVVQHTTMGLVLLLGGDMLD